MARNWLKSRASAPNPEPPTNPCPVCVHLSEWHRDGPIQQATHGAGGPDWEWHACWDHYKVIQAFQWLGWTGQIKTAG